MELFFFSCCCIWGSRRLFVYVYFGKWSMLFVVHKWKLMRSNEDNFCRGDFLAWSNHGYLLGFNNITRCPTKMVSMNQIPKMSPNAICCHKLGPILTASGHLGSYSGKPWTSNSLRPVSGFVDLGWHKIYLETLRLLRISKISFKSYFLLLFKTQ